MTQEGLSFNLRDAGDIKCDECENLYFIQIYRIKKVSPVISPTGKEIMAPIQIFACNKCGHINEGFLE